MSRLGMVGLGIYVVGMMTLPFVLKACGTLDFKAKATPENVYQLDKR